MDGKRLALFGMVCALVGVATLMCATVHIVALVGVVAMVIGLGANNSATYLLLTMCFPKMVGSAAGWVLAMGLCGPLVLSPVMAQLGVQAGLGILLALTGGCVAMLSVCLAVPQSTLYVDTSASASDPS